MIPDELVCAGKLSEALTQMVAEVRDHPQDLKRRSFLMELLCFAGEYERAEKHLNLLARATPDSELGSLLYRSALLAQRKREALFEGAGYPQSAAAHPPSSGTLNGQLFHSIEDLDPRIGPHLEMFVAGEYVWLAFEHIDSLTLAPPRYLRDSLWAAATVQTGPTFKGKDFGEVLIPMLTPFAWRHEQDKVKLGHFTDWRQDGDQLIPFGQKLLVLDEEIIVPFMEIRELRFNEACAQNEPETATALDASPQ